MVGCLVECLAELLVAALVAWWVGDLENELADEWAAESVVLMADLMVVTSEMLAVASLAVLLELHSAAL